MKRGMSGPVIGLVLILVVVALFMFLTHSWGNTLFGASDRNRCKASVEANAARFYEGFDFVVSEIKCPPSDIRISSSDSNVVFSQIANATYHCWDNFGEGKKSLFILGRGQEEQFCVICSYIKFVGEAVGRQQTRYGYYLMTTPLPVPGDRRSYSEYFSYQKPTPQDIEEARSANDFIDTDKEYVVLFAYGKRKGFWDKPIVGGAAAIGGGIIAGVASFFTFGTSGILYVIAMGIVAGGATGFAEGPDLYINWTSGVVLAELNSPELINQGCTRFGQ